MTNFAQHPLATRILRASAAPTLIVLAMLATSLSKTNEEKLRSEGAAAYFEKSALELEKSSDRLMATIQTVLGRASRQSKPHS